MTRDAFYRALEGIHNLYFSTLRFSQFVDIFLGYLKYEKKIDPYYITDEELIKLLREYVDKKR